MAKSLLTSNPYLRNPSIRREWLERNARQSSIFEGARLKPTSKRHKPRVTASAKKAANKS